MLHNSPIYVIDVLQKSQIHALLDLERDNLKDNLDSETIETQGFVTFMYEPTDIEHMMSDAPQIIARADDKIIGYALAITRQTAEKIPLMRIVNDLCTQIPVLSDKKFYFMGQVCVRESYRGKGIFDALYSEHKKVFENKYDALVTEIATDNPRSLNAHKRVGFEIIYQYTDDYHKKEWNVVAWFFHKI